MSQDLRYMTGFGNHFETEAVAGALPIGRNSPQKPPLGLYTELLSGSAFTVGQKDNQRSWLYKIRPSAGHKKFTSLHLPLWESGPLSSIADPNRLRWDAWQNPSEPLNFLQGIRTICIAGAPAAQSGLAVHLYAANQKMTDLAFYNADGDMLIMPQEGDVYIKTEFGDLTVAPCEIAVIQRGIKFRVDPLQKSSRGYVAELYGSHFQLPDRGPIGSNGLANSRDFQTPVARFEESNTPTRLISKFNGAFWETQTPGSVFDVVAWHGNYAPYKYDLNRFNTIGTVSYDHPDPSIFTVLTSPSGLPGTANCDFVIFPPRWMVAEDTFRPPWYHRNVMSEYMGLITGQYDAKPGGFVPGGGSLHNALGAHGPDLEAFTKATEADLKPAKQIATMAFMLESRLPYHTTNFAIEGGLLQSDYDACWNGLDSNFRRS